MCRLFGLSSAPQRVRATFWLLDEQDSLAVQSRRNPDGTGIGVFGSDGSPRLFRQPVAAWRDSGFAKEAHRLESATFLAHIRYASTGATALVNTHPFEQCGRLFAHNGVIEELDVLEAELARGPDVLRRLVHGDTDSERFFALITREIEANDGDVGAGITSAVRWVAENLPIHSLNLVLTTRDDLWALRYPDTHTLFVLDRPPGGRHGDRQLEHAGTNGRLRVRAQDLRVSPGVVIASERMDENPAWRLLDAGELLHVGPDHAIDSRIVIDREPARRLTEADLRPEAAASQRES